MVRASPRAAADRLINGTRKLLAELQGGLEDENTPLPRNHDG
jgi:hypothetical protein